MLKLGTGVLEDINTVKIIGVGSGAANILSHNVIFSWLDEAERIAIDTSNAISENPNNDAITRLLIGEALCKGLGGDAKPEIGEKATRMDEAKIAELLADADQVFVVACMGGGTGTGGAHVVASIAKEIGAWVIGVVTMPFDYEGPKRKKNAQIGVGKLSEHVDALMVIENNALMHQPLYKDKDLKEVLPFCGLEQDFADKFMEKLLKEKNKLSKEANVPTFFSMDAVNNALGQPFGRSFERPKKKKYKPAEDATLLIRWYDLE